MCDNVSVLYRMPREPIASLKEYALKSLRGQVHHREFWALQNVSLRVRHGESLGIVGRNGAGKSTLLKIIARVLRPTTGRVRVAGRIAPLLELGAGFHPELTARENVYLNGALLGHTRREVERHFDEIIEFSDLGEFIDAPLRTFSSGMVVRLGFAAATAWEPDILLVDEVLAVGDESFRRKCLQRMTAFAAHGVTLLLVSHSAEQVESLCANAIWLDRGVVRAAGTSADVVGAYRSAS